MPEVLFDALLHVHYGQAYVVPDASPGFGMEDAFRGQTNGLCGASVRGCLFLITALHTGGVQFRVELHDRAPADLEGWEDVVEVPFSASGRTILQEWAGEGEYPLHLPEGEYRARYAANAMDAGKAVDTDSRGPDSYLLQFWPDAARAPDAIVRRTSRCAEYWHNAVLRW
jgi:hypothetical protein